MAKLFDISKINTNDPLREKKIETLTRIEELTKDLKQDSKVLFLQDKVIEKYMPLIIQEACGSEEDLIEKIINSQSEKEVETIEVKINESLEKHGWELSYNLNDIFYGSSLTNIMTIDSYKRKGKEDELLAMLKNDLVKFDEAVPEIYHCYADELLFVKTAIGMLQDSLLANIEDCEARIEKSQGDSEQQKKDKKLSQEGHKAQDILCRLQMCEFSWSPHSSSVVVNGWSFTLNKKKHFSPTLTVEAFREELEREINQVNDEWLPVGKKKADLLKKLEEVIENGIREVKNQDNHKHLRGSKEHWEETLEDSGFIEYARKEEIKHVMDLLNEEPVIKEEDLKVENRNWLERIKSTDKAKEMYEIRVRVSVDIISKRKIKKQNVDLDDILEEAVDARNFANHFQTTQRSLGESEIQVKAERAKKKLIEHDPELYFNTFNNWIKGEEEALELESKNKVLVAELEAIQEIKYNEEEEQFLAGEITDRKKQEEIIQRIEEKLNVKKKTWKLWKWLEEKVKWSQTKARAFKNRNKVGFEKKVEKIKQEINNVENSSNLHERKAFKHSKNKAEVLLRELESITNENINTTSDSHKFGWGLGIGAALLIVTLVIRQRKKKLSK